MKKFSLISTALASAILFSQAGFAASTATLAIDANIGEAPCSIAFSVPNIHVGTISRDLLGATPVVVPGTYTSNLQVSCPAKANAAISVVDGSPGTIDPAVATAGANFAFGNLAGYYITVNTPQVGTDLTAGSLASAKLVDNSVSGSTGANSITTLKPAGFQWLMSDDTVPNAQQFQAMFNVYPIMPAVTVLDPNAVDFYGSVIATVNFAT
ncbi:MAG: hypothetical protein ACRC5A_06685 [Enterobacteriaceae bacterium]